jgi:hypothetical protein
MLVLRENVRVSDHGFDELRKDGILPSDAIAGILTAKSIEDYPDRARGPSALALQRDADGRPIHVVWAIPAGEDRSGGSGDRIQARSSVMGRGV